MRLDELSQKSNIEYDGHPDAWLSKAVDKHPESMPILNNLCKQVSALSSMISCDILDSSCIAEYKRMKFEAKEIFLKEFFKDRINKSKSGKWFFAEKKSRKDGSEYYIYKARPLGETKFLSSNSYEGLVEQFFNLYTGATAHMPKLGDVYIPATKWKASQPNVSGKTMYDYSLIWNKYISGSTLSTYKVCDIDYDKLTAFYETVCTVFHLNYSQVQDIRNVLSYLMKYCLKEHLITYNPALFVDYKNLPYAKSAGKKDKIKKTPFTPAQTDKIKAWCDEQLKKCRINPLHPLGIKFGLIMADRYGELRAIKWSDIDFDSQTITIEDQAVEQYELKDDMSFEYSGRQSAGHIKGYEDPRPLPLPDEAKEILLQIKAMRLDKTYVFPSNHFRYNTFNNKVKEAAESIGLRPEKYSTHSLRATAATNLYLKTHDIYQVQLLLHHTTPEMTMKYIKDLEINEKLRQSMMFGLSDYKVVNSGEQKETA